MGMDAHTEMVQVVERCFLQQKLHFVLVYYLRPEDKLKATGNMQLFLCVCVPCFFFGKISNILEKSLSDVIIAAHISRSHNSTN